jgi:glyoxalase family protein
MSGIHHVTAIAGNASRNVDFYTRVLGLRLVKKTVNFDDPGTYHLYFGDELGRPGTILTFFAWEHAAPGRNGNGLAEETAFRVPRESIGYWTHRLIEHGAATAPLERRFDESVLPFTDPDGLRIALVGSPGGSAETAWHESPVAPEYAIRGFHGVTLMLDQAGPTGAVLTDVFGFAEKGREGSLVRYAIDQVDPGATITIREARGFLPGHLGRGSVHHIAFRASDDVQQAAMADKVRKAHRLTPTEQRDRKYFRSVYFREPGGILFEIATDAPGFAVDEPVATLGRDLKLPPFLEGRRKEIEAVLPALEGVSA